MPELWDSYLPNGEKAGKSLTRDEAIPAGLYHIVADVLVKHADGDYLVMQRDFHKKGYPGKFESGASGSILLGETPYEGALRELREETGITTDHLTFLFAASDLQDTLYFSYLCITDCAKDSITLQEGETIAYQWLDEAAFNALMQTDTVIPGARDRWKPYMDTVSAYPG